MSRQLMKGAGEQNGVLTPDALRVRSAGVLGIAANPNYWTHATAGLNVLLIAEVRKSIFASSKASASSYEFREAAATFAF